MDSKVTLTLPHQGGGGGGPWIPAAPLPYRLLSNSYRGRCNSNSNSSSTARITNKRRRRGRFELVVVQSHGDNRWKLNGIDADTMQRRVNKWVSNTQDFLSEVTFPLVLQSGRHVKKSDPGNALNAQDMDGIFMVDQTIDSTTPNGNLSLLAIISIEQFSRMNGLTGKKMQNFFAALVPESVYNDARNLVEYCCFSFLARDSSDVHPCLKEPTFQRLIFVTMLAWESPYCEKNVSPTDSERPSFQGKLVKEEAFVRIAPAIAGLAEPSTVHNLFSALAGEEGGISLNLWSMFIVELLKIHEGRKSYQIRECSQLSEEKILCIGSSRKRPVLKWNKNMAWPGKLTLTDKALYFETIGLIGKKEVKRLDLTKHDSCVKKTKVGPLGSCLFDSAVSVSSGLESERWVLEFVDLGGEMRRDSWHAFISEVITLYKFIHEFGPEDDDQSVFRVFGAAKGKERAIISASNSIARLQALQFMQKMLDDPTKLVQFSYLKNAPYGDVVYQTLAVNYWGGPLLTKISGSDYKPAQGEKPSEIVSDINNHVFDIDQSVYLQNWKKSPSWFSTASIMFWKNTSIRQGTILSKNLVVADMTLVERAAVICKEKFQELEKTQATIDAAMLEGIPSNIDLFKELVLPLIVTAKNIEKLRRWEEPHLTVSFLALTYAIIFRNLLSYIFPMSLMILAAGMLFFKRLKEQGRLGRSFGKVTIRDQPPSNTLQKIMAVKGAMDDVENLLQNLNVALLKIRTIVLSGQPQVTAEVAVVLLICGSTLLIVPFKYIVAFLVLDLFTRELELRRGMVLKFMSFLKERWDTVPAAPVVVLPFKSGGKSATNQKWETSDKKNRKQDSSSGKSR